MCEQNKLHCAQIPRDQLTEECVGACQPDGCTQTPERATEPQELALSAACLLVPNVIFSRSAFHPAHAQARVYKPSQRRHYVVLQNRSERAVQLLKPSLRVG